MYSVEEGLFFGGHGHEQAGYQKYLPFSHDGKLDDSEYGSEW